MPRDALPIRGLVTEDEVQESLDFLLRTAEEAAVYFAQKEVGEMRIKQAKSATLSRSLGRNTDQREAEAMASSGVERAIKAYQEVVEQSTRLFHMRRFHELRIEVWRSYNANMRQVKL